MNLASMATDNITELLVKVIEFTQKRQKILIQNIKNLRRPGFVPQDLAVAEFCNSLNAAIDEHYHSRRLVLFDSNNVRFGAGGVLKLVASVDSDAQVLLEQNPDQYLELQTDKLMENAINQRLAVELLRQKHAEDS